MGQKQVQRWHLIKMVEGRKITLREAGEKMGVSYRHAKRIRRAIRREGSRGSFMGIGVSLLSAGSMMRYGRRSWGFRRGFTGVLMIPFYREASESEGVVLSRETVRKLRRGVG